MQNLNLSLSAILTYLLICSEAYASDFFEPKEVERFSNQSNFVKPVILESTELTDQASTPTNHPHPSEFLTASDGSEINRIEIDWSEFSPDASMFSNPGYEVLITIPQTSVSNERVEVRQVPYQAGESNLSLGVFSVFGIPEGVLLNFQIRTCGNLAELGTGLPSTNCVTSEHQDTGFALGGVSTSYLRVGLNSISWDRFSPQILRYRIERCLFPSDSECTFLDNWVTTTSYNDSSGELDVTYTYKIYACETERNRSCIMTGQSGPSRFWTLRTPDAATSITASDGSKKDEIDVDWPEFPTEIPPAAPGEFRGRPGFELLITNPASPGSSVALVVGSYRINETTVNTGDGQQLPSGVLLNFRINTCADYLFTIRDCAISTTQDSGFALAQFSASSLVKGEALVEWVSFSPQTIRYRLERCLDVNNGQCIFLDVGNSLSYRDSSTLIGESYKYAIYACAEEDNSSCVKTGDTNSITISNQDTPDPISFVSASDGTQLNEIALDWSEFSPTATNFDDPGYIVEIINQASLGDTLVREIAYQANGSNDVFRTGTSRELPSGVLLNFSVRSCTGHSSTSPRCAASVTSDTGFAIARFPSGSPSAGVAKLDWTAFSADTHRYRLERCINSPTPQCTYIEMQTATSYEDVDVTPGESYSYSVYACRTSLNSECVKTGITDDIIIANDIQADQFEDDDTPFELNSSNQTITASVTQPRSFDTANDQDWARITFESGLREFDIRTTSSIESVDTQITLFDANGRLVGCALNTPNVITGNARLRLPSLPAGEYYLRVEQQDNGSILGPVESYNLITTISVDNSGSAIEFPDCSVIDGFPRDPNAVKPIAPIIELLLE